MRGNSNFDFEACIKEFKKLVFKIKSFYNICSNREFEIFNSIKNFLDNPAEENFEIFVMCCRDNEKGNVFGTEILSEEIGERERKGSEKVKKKLKFNATQNVKFRYFVKYFIPLKLRKSSAYVF